MGSRGEWKNSRELVVSSRESTAPAHRVLLKQSIVRRFKGSPAPSPQGEGVGGEVNQSVVSSSKSVVNSPSLELFINHN